MTRAARCRAVLAATPNQVGVVFNAQSTNEDLYALARLAFDHLHVGKAYIAGLRPGLARRHPGVGRQEPEHRGRDGDRRGPAAQPARPVERPEGGRGDGADRRRHAGRARRGRRARGAAAGTAAGAGRDRHAPGRGRRRPPTSRCRSPSGPRSTARSPTAWAWSSACAPPCRPPATRCPAGRSCRTWRASSAPRWSTVEAKAVFAEAKQKLPFMKRRTGAGRCCPCSSASPTREADAAMDIRQRSVRGGHRHRQDPVPGARLPDAAGVDPDLGRAAAVRDDAGPAGPEPRQHRPDQGLGASPTSSPTR